MDDDEALINAARNGQAAEVGILLPKIEKWETKHLAAEQALELGHAAVSDYIVAEGMTTGERGESLRRAAFKRDLPLLQILNFHEIHPLIRKGCQHVMVAKGELEVFIALTTSPLSSEEALKFLRIALAKNHENILLYLLEQAGTPQLKTELCYRAVEEGNLPMVKLLMGLGVEWCCEKALHEALQTYKPRLIYFLLEEVLQLCHYESYKADKQVFFSPLETNKNINYWRNTLCLSLKDDFDQTQFSAVCEKQNPVRILENLEALLMSQEQKCCQESYALLLEYCDVPLNTKDAPLARSLQEARISAVIRYQEFKSELCALMPPLDYQAWLEGAEYTAKIYILNDLAKQPIMSEEVIKEAALAYYHNQSSNLFYRVSARPRSIIN